MPTTRDTHTDGICSMVTLHVAGATIITITFIILIWFIAAGFADIKQSVIPYAKAIHQKLSMHIGTHIENRMTNHINLTCVIPLHVSCDTVCVLTFMVGHFMGLYFHGELSSLMDKLQLKPSLFINALLGHYNIALTINVIA